MMGDVDWNSGVQGALAAVTDVTGASAALRQLLGSLPTEAGTENVASLKLAFDYYPRSDPQRGYWGPLIGYTNGSQYPPELTSLPDKHLDVWVAALADLTLPAFAQARLADLLWSRRWAPQAHEWARQASDAYLTVAAAQQQSNDRFEAVESASRAHVVAREVGDTARETIAAAELMAAATAESESPDPKPGTLLRALSPLVQRCPEVLVAERDRLLRKALDDFDADPFAFQSAVELLAGTLPVADRPALYERVADRWVRAADESNGMLTLTHLEHALEFAKLRGLSWRLAGLRVRIQQLDKTTLGLQEIVSSVEIPDVAQVAAGLAQPNWSATLRAIGSTGPLSGRGSDNQDALAEQRRQAPFASIVASVKLGPANSVIFRAHAGTPERDRMDLAEIETRRLALNAVYIMAALDLAGEQIGPPDIDRLIGDLVGDVITADVAHRFARAVSLYVQAEYELATLLALPSIESCLRSINRICGLPIVREPIGQTPGGVKTLAPLLDQLVGVMEPDWCRYLTNALCDPLGLNLRNRALHGLIDEATKMDAVVALHIVGFLATLTATQDLRA
jgi:hypothetical protein